MERDSRNSPHDTGERAKSILRPDAREFLWQTGAGFTGVALTGLLSADGFFGGAPARAAGGHVNPLAPRPPHSPGKAKSVIFLFMSGGPARLVERGVRFVQVYSGGGAQADDTNWDAHKDIVVNHTLHAGRTDKPIAGLLKDLKRRGLLDSTLVVWGGEFGRQPTAEYAKGTGRDHNSYGFTMWLAGGGVKGGVSVGATDELGSAAVQDRFHVKHLHATILHQLGLSPNRLSFFYNGPDQRLVGVEGAEPIRQVIA